MTGESQGLPPLVSEPQKDTLFMGALRNCVGKMIEFSTDDKDQRGIIEEFGWKTLLSHEYLMGIGYTLGAGASVGVRVASVKIEGGDIQEVEVSDLFTVEQSQDLLNGRLPDNIFDL